MDTIMNTKVITIDREAIMMTTLLISLGTIAILFKILGEML